MKRIGTVGRFAILGLVAMALVAALLGRQIFTQIEEDALAEAVEDVKATLVGRVAPHLDPTNMSNPTLDVHYGDIRSFIQDSLLTGRVVRVKIWNREGRVVYSDREELVGQVFPIGSSLESALRGEVVADVSSLESEENEAEKAEFERLLEVYVPLRFAGSREVAGANEVAGAYEAYYRWAPVAERIAGLQRVVLTWLGIGLVVLYLIALVMLNGAARTITRLLRQAEVRARELETVYANLQETHLSTLESLAAAVEARDPYTYGHVTRVREYALVLAREIDYGDGRALETLGRAAILHDIGKIGVADSILRKPGKLDPSEYAQMKQHPELGCRLLQRISFLRDELLLIRHHHERYDGLGYPDGLTGEQIPLGARILLVADALDAMTTDRPYRRALPIGMARAELEMNAGKMFCPVMVNAMLRMIDEGLVPVREATGTAVGVG